MKIQPRSRASFLLAFLFSAAFYASSIHAQGTAFTYQGRLTDGGAPANGSYDLRFILDDAEIGGSQHGPILTNAATAVSNGLFIVTLDFGDQFSGAARWLEIQIRTNGAGGFISLIPRQALTASPYAITAGKVISGGLASGSYANAVNFNNAANQFAGTFTGNGAGVTNVNAGTLDGVSSEGFRKTSGNGGTTTASILGTTDNQPLELKVNGVRALRFEPNTNGAPNVIAGAPNNYVAAGVIGATIGGGGVTNDYGFAHSNSVTANYGVVAGGLENVADVIAVVGGGQRNVATGAAAVISGGTQNIASGDNSAVPGGDLNVAAGFCSFAAGYLAQALHDDTFVWNDGSGGQTFASTVKNQFLVRAAGGVGIGTNHPAGALHVASASSSPQVQITQNNSADYARLRMNAIGSPFWEMDVSSGATPSLQFWNSNLRMSVDYNGNVSATSFNPSSDRKLKENFTAINPGEVLEKVAALPITHWNFKTDAGTEHIGPMAQDFYAAFGLGPDNKHIATVDADGVALAAIQGLNQKLEAKETQIQNQAAEISDLKTRLEKLEEIIKTKEQTQK